MTTKIQTAEADAAYQAGRSVRAATPQQLLAFARLHDWGRDAEIVAEGIRVGCDIHHPTTGWTRDFTVVSNMRALRMWAGY